MRTRMPCGREGYAPGHPPAQSPRADAAPRRPLLIRAFFARMCVAPCGRRGHDASRLRPRPRGARYTLPSAGGQTSTTSHFESRRLAARGCRPHNPPVPVPASPGSRPWQFRRVRPYADLQVASFPCAGRGRGGAPSHRATVNGIHDPGPPTEANRSSGCAVHDVPRGHHPLWQVG
jgi:hypothetical protein